jgi:hypothetical protein
VFQPHFTPHISAKRHSMHTTINTAAPTSVPISASASTIVTVFGGSVAIAGAHGGSTFNGEMGGAGISVGAGVAVGAGVMVGTAPPHAVGVGLRVSVGTISAWAASDQPGGSKTIRIITIQKFICFLVIVSPSL